MPVGWRILLSVAIVLASVRAWRVSSHDLEMRAGARAYGDRQYRLALERFERARAGRPSDPLAWTWIGDSAGALLRNVTVAEAGSPDATRLADRMWAGYAGAVLRAPRDSWSWSGLAEAALQRARLSDAGKEIDLETLDRRRQGIWDPWRASALGAATIATGLKPSGYLEADVLASVYESAGQTDRARETLVRSARMNPAPSAHEWGTGHRRFAAPLYAGILAGLREGVGNAPDFERSRLHREIGRFALTQGDAGTALEAMRASEAAATTDDERYLALRGQAESLEKLGRTEEAIAALDRAIPLGRGAAVDLRMRGTLRHRAGREAEACRDLLDALRAESGDAGLRAFTAVACEEAGETDAAERALRDGFVDPVEDPVLARALLDLYVRSSRRETALALAKKWVRDHPDRPDFAAWLDGLTVSAR